MDEFDTLIKEVPQLNVTNFEEFLGISWESIYTLKVDPVLRAKLLIYHGNRQYNILMEAIPQLRHLKSFNDFKLLTRDEINNLEISRLFKCQVLFFWGDRDLDTCMGCVPFWEGVSKAEFYCLTEEDIRHLPIDVGLRYCLIEHLTSLSLFAPTKRVDKPATNNFNFASLFVFPFCENEVNENCNKSL